MSSELLTVLTKYHIFLLYLTGTGNVYKRKPGRECAAGSNKSDSDLIRRLISEKCFDGTINRSVD